MVMETGSAIILGVVQGLTEFLPVSSSAHLAIAQEFLPSFSQPGLLFDVIIHLGTTLAVIYYFRARILIITVREALILGLATVPAVVFGFLFKDMLESMFQNMPIVGITLMVTGILNFLVNKAQGVIKKVGAWDAILIGVAQAIAILPGISRSGSTIFAGVSLGIERKKAAEFSFLMSIPAILGANVLQLYSHGTREVFSFAYLAGFLAAFIVGLLSINILLKLLTERKFSIFGVYCLILGALTLAASLL